MFWKKRNSSTLERDIQVFNEFAEELSQDGVEFTRGEAKKEAKRLLKELYPDQYPKDFEYWEDVLDGFSAETYKDSEFKSGAECFLYGFRDLMQYAQEDEKDKNECDEKAINLWKIFK